MLLGRPTTRPHRGNNHRRSKRPMIPALLVLSISMVSMAGCADNDPRDKVAAMNDLNIKRVANLYTAYQFRHGFAGPKDEAALLDFIQHGMSPEKLRMMQVDVSQVEGLLTSDRDGRPFKIKYGVPGGIGVVTPVVFEEVGKEGKRQVGFTGGTVEEVDDARYAQLLGAQASSAEAHVPVSG